MNIFDLWNKKKQDIENNSRNKYVREREIWFVQLGKNIGDEEDGKGKEMLRPVLVYKKFNRHIFIGLPLSTTDKDGKYYCQFEHKEKTSNALLSQIRLFDVKRCKYRHGRISVGDFIKVKQKLIALLQ